MRKQTNNNYKILVVLSMLFLLISCKTEIHVGNNDKVIPDETQDLNDSATFGQYDSLQDSKQLNCFINSQEFKELPDEINYFCSTQKTLLSEQEFNDLKPILDKLCVQKELSKLFLPSCGWQGDYTNQKKFFKVLENTDINNTNQNNFYYLSSFSLTLPYKPNKNLKNSMFEAYSNPQKYLEKYKPIPNVNIIPSSQSPVILSNGYIVKYIMEILTPVITVRFESYLKGISITKNLDLIIDKMIGIGSGVTQRNHLTFILSLPNKIIKTVSFEQKIIQDFGQHLLALKLLIQKDLEGMRTAYENYFIE